jgi:hypothetical protein
MPLLDPSDSQLIVVDTQPGFYPPDQLVDRELPSRRPSPGWRASRPRSGCGHDHRGIRPQQPDRRLGAGAGPDQHGRPRRGVRRGRRDPGDGRGERTPDGGPGRSTRRPLGPGAARARLPSRRRHRCDILTRRTHEHGLRRMRDAGVVVHAKGVYYEWVRTSKARIPTSRSYPASRQASGPKAPRSARTRATRGRPADRAAQASRRR